MKKLFLTLIASAILVSTSLHAETVTTIKTPTQEFIEYHELSKTNLNFDIEIAYYTEKKQKEIREKITQEEKRKKKNI